MNMIYDDNDDIEIDAHDEDRTSTTTGEQNHCTLCSYSTDTG